MDFAFRDLNKNGRLDPCEDPRLPIEERVEDLLSQMTLADGDTTQRAQRFAAW